MFKCNNCNLEFEHYDTIREPSGEKWYVCPMCRGADFDEIQQRAKDDKFLFIKKVDVADFVTIAVSFLNTGDIDTAKEALYELISQMVSDEDFDYKSRLDSLASKDQADKLTADIQEMLEVVKV